MKKPALFALTQPFCSDVIENENFFTSINIFPLTAESEPTNPVIESKIRAVETCPQGLMSLESAGDFILIYEQMTMFEEKWFSAFSI